ncbi:unnamed protein product [Oreochromis niloticus]|nr:unnamed protein product [Mustela putorius furo]
MKSSQHETTEWSDSVTLTVSDNKPRPVLTVSPSWLSPGASVTLNCEVEHPSAGWSFYWYKAVPDLSEKSSSYELLPDGSGTAQDSYIIHGQTHTAGYVCRAGRGDPEYHTDHSQPKFVWSADVHSAASLTVSPDRVQHFTSDSVSLTCEGNFTEWRVRKFSEDGRLYSDCRRMTGSTCNINTSKSDTAVYWCESGSGEFSSAVNITVQNDGNGPILVSPVHPVTEGASVSLSCSLRTQKILSNVFFYHNDKLIQNDTRGELKISAVSKSDEGFYKCQYSGRESAQSWMSVKVTVSGADSSSSPVWLIVGLVCGVSLIIILLLLLYRCRQSKCADKPPDVIYSNIELENFGNKWKHHKPEQSAVYTNVKTGAAEDSLMYAEVKQPKKQKAKKNKGKSSPAADAAVYSEVTSGSSLSDLSVYEPIRGSGNTGSADEYNNLTSEFQLEGLDKRRHEAGMEEIKTPDIQRPPEHKRPRKTNRGAAAPLSQKELRRVPDEGSLSSRGAEARGGCSDVPVSSAGSQLCLSGRAPGREAEGTPSPKWPERAPGSRLQAPISSRQGVSRWVPGRPPPETENHQRTDV